MVGTIDRTAVSRRALIAGVLTAFPVYALLGQSTAARAGSVRAWIRHHDAIAHALADGSLSPVAWKTEVARLAESVDVTELLSETQKARRRPIGRALESYPDKTSVTFLDEDGNRRRLRYAAALFHFRPTDVITPHAHRHMASAHMVVEGAFRVRTFDRVRDDTDAIILRASGDAVLGTGAISSMSSDRDNVHWFVPSGGPAATFDIIVSSLDAGAPPYLIQPVDPVRGTTLPDGTLRAPLIGFEEAAQVYTAGV